MRPDSALITGTLSYESLISNDAEAPSHQLLTLRASAALHTGEAGTSCRFQVQKNLKRDDRITSTPRDLWTQGIHPLLSQNGVVVKILLLK